MKFGTCYWVLKNLTSIITDFLWSPVYSCNLLGWAEYSIFVKGHRKRKRGIRECEVYWTCTCWLPFGSYWGACCFWINCWVLFQGILWFGAKLYQVAYLIIVICACLCLYMDYFSMFRQVAMKTPDGVRSPIYFSFILKCLLRHDLIPIFYANEKPGAS